jgi:hypothetical protein
MKKKAILVLLLGVMGLAALSIGNAEAAAPPWYVCTISQVGTSGGYYVVTLSDTTTPTAVFTDRQFVLSTTTLGKEIYAAALTAWANSSYVYVNLPNTGAWKPIVGLYAATK